MTADGSANSTRTPDTPGGVSGVDGWRWMLAVVVLACLAAPASAMDRPADLLASGELDPRLAEPLGTVLNSEASPEQRRLAATALLEADTRRAQPILLSLLAEASPPHAWRAVVQAVALLPDEPPRDLAWPMIARLTAVDDAPERADLVDALGRFDDEAVVGRTFELARNAQQPLDVRTRFIAAIGAQRTQRAAEVLLELTEPDQPEPVRAAAFKALGALTGLEELGSDRSAWAHWWDRARRLSREQWHEHLMTNLSRREAGWRLRLAEVEQRLLESQRAHYRTTRPEDRQAFLVYVLNDPLTPIRQLGLDLALQRLLNDEPFDETLRGALRSRLLDRSAAVRQRAAVLLRDLSDRMAADLVAERVGERQEHVDAVLRAYLQLLARMPRARAVPAVLDLLEEEPLRAEAAAALSAAIDAALLSADQSASALKRLRKVLSPYEPPAPSVIGLLGRVGQEQEWKRIAEWVDHPDRSIKQAAAEAWADSSRSLKWLADRVSDPVIQPIVIRAATARGRLPETMRTLAEHPPAVEQVREAWRLALIAMAGRVPMQTVLFTAERLEQLDEPPSMIERLLTAALDATPSQPPAPEAVALLLKRAEVRQSVGNDASALSDYLRVASVRETLGAAERQRLDAGLIDGHLRLGETAAAFEVAAAALERDGGGGSRDELVELFLEAARRHAEAREATAAQTILNGLVRLLGPAMRPEVAQRVALLEAQVSGMALPPTTPDNDAESPRPSLGNSPADSAP